MLLQEHSILFFNITTDSSCNNVIYSDSQSLTTDSRGIISHYLENVNLDYDNQYYLCYYRDGSLVNSSKIARTPYAFRAKYVNVSGIQVDSNFDLTGFNFSADYVFGDGSGLTNLDTSALDLSAYVQWTNLWDQVYNETEVNAINTSMRNYVIYTNGTMKDYVDTKVSADLSTYVEWTALWTQVYNETEVNNLLNAYVTWAGIWAQVYNETEVQAINTSMRNYVNYVNTTGAAYTNTRDTYFNTTIAAYVNSENSRYNTSIASYVNTRSLSHFNDDILWTAGFNSTGDTRWLGSADLNPYVEWVDLWGQVYNETEVQAINTSMRNYVNYVNTTGAAYTNTRDTYFNTTIAAYVNSENSRYNNSIASYVNTRSLSDFNDDILWTAGFNSTGDTRWLGSADLNPYVEWVDLWGQVYNETEVNNLLNQKASWTTLWSQVYNETEVQAINTSMRNYVNYVNTTGAAYTNTRDTYFNTTIAAYVNSENSRYNTSIASYVNTRSLSDFNDDILWTAGFNSTGDTRWLSGSFTESDPYWTGNSTLVAYLDTSNSGGINTTGDICITGGNCLSDMGVGSGDITEVNTNGPYLSGGSDSGIVNLVFDTSNFNSTYDNRYLGITAKAADSDLLDGLDSSHFYNASNPAGYITNVALNSYIEWVDLWSQVYNETEVQAINTSMRNYVNYVNTTGAAYTNTRDTYFNTTIAAYVNSEDARYNTSIASYVNTRSLSDFNDDILWTAGFNSTGDTRWLGSADLNPYVEWVDLWSQVYNETEVNNLLNQKASWTTLWSQVYNETEVQAINTSMRNYVNYVNTTGAAYTNTRDTYFNTTIAAYVNSENSRYNTSIASYVNTRSLSDFNDDILWTAGFNSTGDTRWLGSADLNPYVEWVDLWGQVYNETEVQAINTSMRNYVNYVNTTGAAYTNTRDTYFNTTIAAYVNSEDARYNTSIASYVNTRSLSDFNDDILWTAGFNSTGDTRWLGSADLNPYVEWVDLWGQVYNETEVNNLLNQKASWTTLWAQVYNETEVQAINTSMRNYVNYVNTTGAAYTNTRDTYFNTTIAAYVNSENSRYNTSIASYVNTRSLSDFNDDILWTAGFNSTGDTRWLGSADLNPYVEWVDLWGQVYNETEVNNLLNQKASWTTLWAQVYNETEVQAINTSMRNYVNYVNTTGAAYTNTRDTYFNTTIAAYVNSENSRYNTSIASYVDNTFLRKDGDNGTGQYDFNGGWTSDGLSIIDGDIYAQTVYAYNISSLQVSNLNVNGSLIPQEGFDNQFDIGSSGERWRSGYFGTNLYVNGTVYSENQEVITNEVDPHWTGNYSSRTGTGNVVYSNSPTLVSPTLGAATATTLNTGYGAKELGGAAVADGDTANIPTGDQVYDFVTGQGYLVDSDLNPYVEWTALWTQVYNETEVNNLLNQKASWTTLWSQVYNETEVQAINTSMRNYVNYVNTTGAAYTNTRDTYFNTTIAAYVNSENSRYNTSIASYVNTRSLSDFNDDILWTAGFNSTGDTRWLGSADLNPYVEWTALWTQVYNETEVNNLLNQKASWTTLWSQVYNETEVQAINTSMRNYVNYVNTTGAAYTNTRDTYFNTTIAAYVNSENSRYNTSIASYVNTRSLSDFNDDILWTAGFNSTGDTRWLGSADLNPYVEWVDLWGQVYNETEVNNLLNQKASWTTLWSQVYNETEVQAINTSMRNYVNYVNTTGAAYTNTRDTYFNTTIAAYVNSENSRYNTSIASYVNTRSLSDFNDDILWTAGFNSTGDTRWLGSADLNPYVEWVDLWGQVYNETEVNNLLNQKASWTTLWSQVYNETEVQAINTSMRNYVNYVNTTGAAYTNTRDTYFNTTIAAYVNSENSRYNTSIASYVNTRSLSHFNDDILWTAGFNSTGDTRWLGSADLNPYVEWVDLWGQVYNETEVNNLLNQKASWTTLWSQVYNETEVQAINTSMRNYVNYVNTTGAAYTNTRDTYFNTTIAAYVNSENSRYNTSIASYVNTRSLSDFNDDILWTAGFNSTGDTRWLGSADLNPYVEWTALWTQVYNETEVNNLLNQKASWTTLWSQVYNETEVQAINTSMRNYVNYVNTTGAAYTNTRDTYFNTTIAAYVNSENSRYNTSIASYVNTRSLSDFNDDILWTAGFNSTGDTRWLGSADLNPYVEWVDLWGQVYNETEVNNLLNQKASWTTLWSQVYNETEVQAINTSMRNYVNYVNTTGAAYTNTRDTYFNTTIAAYVNSENSRYNTSIASYVNTRSLSDFNDDILWTAGFNSTGDTRWLGSADLNPYVEWVDLWGQVYNETEVNNLLNQKASWTTLWSQVYNETEVQAINTSMRNYVNYVNTTGAAYTNTRDTYFNTTIAAYVNSENSRYNTSIASYVNTRSLSHFNDDILWTAGFNSTGDTRWLGSADLNPYVEWVDLWGQVYNETEVNNLLNQKASWTTLWSQVYNETEVQAINTSMRNYVNYVNTTGAAYTNTRDTYFNTTIAAYVNSENSRYNTSIASYVNTRSLSDFNDDILWTAGFNSTGDTRWLGSADLNPYVEWVDLWGQVYNETEVNNLLNAYVTWAGIWAQVYNETEVQAINTSMRNYVDSKPSGSLTGAGTAMRIPLWNGTTSLNNSNIYQGGSGNIGIGGAPDYTLDVAGTMGIDSYLYHNGDADTYLLYDTDRIRFYAGGEQLLDLYETTQDYVKLGDGGDVDINLNDDVFVEGSSSRVGIGTITPQNTLNVLGTANVTGSMIIGNSNITTMSNGDVNVW
jgi:hypothetical protein